MRPVGGSPMAQPLSEFRCSPSRRSARVAEIVHERGINLDVLFDPLYDALVSAVAEGAHQSRREATAGENHGQQRLDQRLGQRGQTAAECGLLEMRGDVAQTQVRQCGHHQRRPQR